MIPEAQPREIRMMSDQELVQALDQAEEIYPGLLRHSPGALDINDLMDEPPLFTPVYTQRITVGIRS
jgi:hypothetical protein